MWFIGVEVDKRRVHPLLKKILDPPLYNLKSNHTNKDYEIKKNEKDSIMNIT